jgi:redox-sensitive bicupin YhaK (pirin superfamily)
MNASLRPSAERGHAEHGWLDSRHTFSFAHYFDPRHMGFRSLRVINDDVVKPGAGFPTHGHRDMEIVTYVVSGALSHRDSTGGQGVIRRGEVQAMSAGTGIRHSEFNASHEEDVRLLQIWILPPRDGLPPAYEQKAIPDADKHNRLARVAGPEGSGAALPLHQDAFVYASLLDAGRSVGHPLRSGRGVWVQVVDGEIAVDGVAMKRGDGLAVEDTERIDIRAATDAEFLLFDLA